MPNRIIREGIVDSRKIAQLSDSAKVLYYKLLSVADDFGRFESDAELLRRRLYMWETERVTSAMVLSWLKECVAEDLLILYSFASKGYLEISSFNQQQRSRSKYPDPSGAYTYPPSREKQRLSTDSNLKHLDNACLATDINCQQLKTNVLVPTRLDSTRIDSCSSERKTGPPEKVEGTEGWSELVEAATEALMVIDPDPFSDLCQKTWRWMPMTDKLDSVQGIRKRVANGQYSDPQYVPALKKYIRDKLWRESLRPARSKELAYAGSSCEVPEI